MISDLDQLQRVCREIAGAAEHLTAPLIATAAAERIDPTVLREVAHPDHLSPDDLLPGARSVISMFLPFRPEVVAAARRARPAVAREWALAYIEGNQIMEQIGLRLAERLLDAGHRAMVRPPTGDFERDLLMSHWSHKHVAVMAGLGQLGRNELVITRVGCAGRLGTVLTTAELDERAPGLPPSCEELCQDSAPCRRSCPVDALPGDEGQIERELCFARLEESAARFADLPDCQVCGICAVSTCARL